MVEDTEENLDVEGICAGLEAFKWNTLNHLCATEDTTANVVGTGNVFDTVRQQSSTIRFDMS